MNGICVVVAGTLCGLILAASAASAQVDVELAFDPPIVSPGDPVVLTTSLENTGTTDVRAKLELAIVWGEFSYTVMAASVPIAAGAKHGSEIPFLAPRFLDQLTLSFSATVGDVTDTSTATLTVLGSAKTSNPETSILRDLVRDAAATVGASEGLDSTESSTISEVKRRYR